MTMTEDQAERFVAAHEELAAAMSTLARAFVVSTDGGGEGSVLLGIEQDLDRLADATRAIAHGPVSGPTGLELVAMALQGKDGDSVEKSLALGLEKIAEAIRDRE